MVKIKGHLVTILMFFAGMLMSMLSCFISFPCQLWAMVEHNLVLKYNSLFHNIIFAMTNNRNVQLSVTLSSIFELYLYVIMEPSIN